jgi:hypothetical protein
MAVTLAAHEQEAPGITAQPDTPGPDAGSYEVIHLGGHAAVVVPVADFLRLRALEQAASPEELKDADDTAAVLAWKARDAQISVAVDRQGRGFAWPVPGEEDARALGYRSGNYQPLAVRGTVPGQVVAHSGFATPLALAWGALAGHPGFWPVDRVESVSILCSYGLMVSPTAAPSCHGWWWRATAHPG